MKLQDEFVSYEIAKELKELGFDEPTPHCYVHDIEEKYELNLFYYLLGGDGELYNVFQNEKNIKSFCLDNIQNESDVYFNYNQDIRKLLAKVYNGEDFMNDEKSYNMNIDSYTYQKWTLEEEKENKRKLPNYNDGDFDFTVYQDVISAPTYSQVFRWFREKYKLHGDTGWQTTNDDINHKVTFWYMITKEDDWTFETCEKKGTEKFGFKTYEESQEACLKQIIEFIKKNKNNGK